jgi:hypothetical protein
MLLLVLLVWQLLLQELYRDIAVDAVACVAGLAAVVVGI